MCQHDIRTATNTDTSTDTCASAGVPITQEHIDLVRRTARILVRFHPRVGMPLFDEIYSAGLVALVEAARRFDPSRGVAFTCYAQQRVKGAMLDELRREARACGVFHWRGGVPTRPLLGGADQDSGPELVDTSPSAEDALMHEESIRVVREAARELPARLRTVLDLRHNASWTLRRIADHLGVTEGRACQLVGESVAILRDRLPVDSMA